MADPQPSTTLIIQSGRDPADPLYNPFDEVWVQNVTYGYEQPAGDQGGGGGGGEEPEPLPEAPPVTGERPKPPPPPPPIAPPILAAPIVTLPDIYADLVGAVPQPQTPPPPSRPRRSKPPARRTRPQRPQRSPSPGPRTTPRILPPSFPRPRPGDPAVPIASPLIRGLVRLLGPVAAMFFPRTTGPSDFRYGTPQRYLIPPTPARDDRPEAGDRLPVRNAPPLARTDEIVTLDIVSRRERPVAPPSVTFDLVSQPLPYPGLPTAIFPGPANQPRETPSPQPVGTPNAAPNPNPALDVFPIASPAPSVRPQPQPAPPPSRPQVDIPLYFAPQMPGPGKRIIGDLVPVPDLGPVPQEELDRCNCEPKKKSKKPKKPRAVCYRGTYTERAKGLIKSRKEQVPCQ